MGMGLWMGMVMGIVMGMAIYLSISQYINDPEAAMVPLDVVDVSAEMAFDRAVMAKR